jgi:single-strand selective monofunctional uracil DNA glycosylase
MVRLWNFLYITNTLNRSPAKELIAAADSLRRSLQPLTFGPPVRHVYNPLLYAWAAHRQYITRFGINRKRILFLGMNPGPFGMAQTGVPFGEVSAVRDWMGIHADVAAPADPHPKRPVLGFDCPRSEVSGRRLWGLFAQRFGTADKFFADHFVVNYCPLAFVEESGCNRTPDKLPEQELSPVLALCDEHLRRVLEMLQPEWLIGVGRFAEQRARAVCGEGRLKVGTILHPSPASPVSNKDWEGTVTRQLQELGIWD